MYKILLCKMPILKLNLTVIKFWSFNYTQQFPQCFTNQGNFLLLNTQTCHPFQTNYCTLSCNQESECPFSQFSVSSRIYLYMSLTNLNGWCKPEDIVWICIKWYDKSQNFRKVTINIFKNKKYLSLWYFTKHTSWIPP